jgi:hypothetical protein
MLLSESQQREGYDNITVAVIAFPGPAPELAGPPETREAGLLS